MHVLVVSCVFPPEPVVSAQTSAQIAEELARCGHNVTVITTFPNRPVGKLYSGYKRRLFQRETILNRIKLVRCFSFFSPKSNIISRLLENLSFGLTGSWAALTTPRADVIYANTWPILATGILFLVAKLRRIPIVISVQDVYPESLVAQQRLQPNNLITRGMRWLDGVIARGSRAVIVISGRFAAIYQNERGVSDEHVHVIPNWADEKSIILNSQPHEFRAGQNIPSNAFVLVYGGNIGVAAGVETVIEAFGKLKNIETLYFVIAGAGSQLRTCKELATTVSSKQIIFHSPWPVEETSQVLRAADVLILPTKGRQSLSSVPSKLISYMLAAKPIIALALPQSDIAEMIRLSECGWVVQPDRPDLLAAKIQEVMAMEVTDLNNRGQAGRQFALKNLTSEICLHKVINTLVDAAT